MRTFTIFFYSLIYNTCIAQPALDSFYRVGTIWCGHEYFPPSNVHSIPMSPYVYKIIGDTIFNNKTYHLVSLNAESRIIGGLRADSNKVFFYKLDTVTYYSNVYKQSVVLSNFPLHTDVLLYDFNIKIGDSVSWKPEGKKTIIDIKQVQLSDGRVVNQYFFENSQFDYWVYGIGSGQGLFGSLYYFPPSKLQVYINSTFYCNLNAAAMPISSCFPLKIQKFNNVHESLSVFPNPLNSDILTIETLNTLRQMTVLDMNSKVVYQHNKQLSIGRNTVRLNIPSGFYYIQFKDINDNNTFFKLIKQ